jgi:hypothetical protein
MDPWTCGSLSGAHPALAYTDRNTGNCILEGKAYMVLHKHHKMLLDIGLAALLVVMLVFQVVAPSGSVSAADTSSVWHLLSQKASNISYTDAVTDGKVVVNVGTRGAVALTSDLVHWESIEQFISKDPYGICRGNGMYVAVGNEGTLFTLTDGCAWTEREVPGDT